MSSLPYGPIVLVLANLIAFGGFSLVPRDEVVLRTYVIVIAGTIGILVYLHDRYHGRPAITVELMSSAGVLIAFLLPSLYFCVSAIELVSIEPYLPLFPDVAFAAILGQSFFFLGHAIRLPASALRQSLKNARSIVSLTRFFQIFAILIVVTWSARILLLVSGSYYHQLRSDFMEEDVVAFSALAQLGGFGIYVLIGIWLQLFLRGKDPTRKRWLKWAIILTVAELLWYFPTGSREPVLLVGISIFTGYVFAYRKVPVRLLLPSVFIALTIIFVMGMYREIIRETASSTSSVKVGEVLSSVSASMELAGDYLETGQWVPIVSRVSESRPVAAIIGGVPSTYPYLWGETYLKILWIPVPRAIYPDKPGMILPINQWFFRGEGGSSPVTLIGEAYFNFGWIGVCSVLLIIGWISGVYDEEILKRIHPYSPYSVIWMAIYVGTAVLAFRLYAQPAGIWISVFIKSVILAWFIVVVAKTIDGKYQIVTNDGGRAS